MSENLIMEITINANDYLIYKDSTYKGFYDTLASKYSITSLEYSTINLYEFLVQNRAKKIHFTFIGLNLNEIMAKKSNDDFQWKDILITINHFLFIKSNITLAFQDCIGEFVTEIIVDRANYKDYEYYTYKGFYEDVFRILDGKDNHDFDEMDNCCYHADILNEFLWYNLDKNIRFVFVDFDVEKLKTPKTYDDCEWNKIIDVVSGFIKEYPNNTIKFVSNSIVEQI